MSAPQQHQDALRAVVLRLLELDVRGHTLADRLQFTPAGRAILEQARSALAGQAAVHAEPVAQKSAEWERRFLSYDPSSDPAQAECAIPPHGWRCTRSKGHDGPCSAVEAPDDVALVRRAMGRLAEQAEPVPPVVTDVLAELAKAVAKFPTWPTDPLHALAVLGEEFGELTKDVLQLCYEPHKTTPESARKEAMQTAAMALRFAMSLGRYEYRPGQQHEQGEA